MNSSEFQKQVSLLGYELSEKQLQLFNEYFEFLVLYNKHTNLTTIIKKEDVYLKHFYDSITLIRKIDFSSVFSLIDVGTGAGFPGVVIKILFPDLDLTLLDSNNKKTIFLEKLIEKLELTKIKVICERSEIFALKNLDSYDIVVARAVKELSVLVELCLPLVKINGLFISMKANVNEELEQSSYAINLLGGTVKEIDNFNLPIENAIRNNIIIQKIKSTISGYPRNYSTILKKPLKKDNK